MPSDSGSTLRIRCSVVITTRDRPQALERCLARLGGLDYPLHEIIVVDSAPERVPADVVAARYGARYICESRPGVSRARNRGACEATGDIVAYLDDDSMPEPEWLTALVDEFEDPMVAAVTGRIRPFKVETEAERLFDSLGGLDCGEHRRVVDAATPHWFELANFGALAVGPNMAFRRSVFRVWPGFDERLGRGAPQNCNEEPHAYFSLIDRGYRIVYTPRSLVLHPCPESLPELRRRYLRDMGWSVAYFTLLAVEHPRYRGSVLHYAWEGLLGRQRHWRPRPTAARRRIAPRWREMLEWMKGPCLYLGMRWHTRGRN